jgi:uncharacterized protein YjiS (DUF1127 family)
MSIQSLILAPTASGPSRRRPFPLLVRRFVDALVEADRRYRERRYLEGMDDRMLRDIGTTRAELDRMLRSPATRP